MAAINVHVTGDNSAHFGFCPAHCTSTLADIQHARVELLIFISVWSVQWLG